MYAIATIAAKDITKYVQIFIILTTSIFTHYIFEEYIRRIYLKFMANR